MSRSDVVMFWICAVAIGLVASSALAAASPAACGGKGQVGLNGDGLVCAGPCQTPLGQGQCVKFGPVPQSGQIIQLYKWDALNQTWAQDNATPIGPNDPISWCECEYTDPESGAKITFSGNPGCCRIVEVVTLNGPRIGTMGTCFACPAAGRCSVDGPANSAEPVCVVGGGGGGD